MPANLSPEYKAAEAAYRKARDPRERLDGLREMLRTIPKHKGTDHLQADIKRRIKELSEELQAPTRGGAARHGPTLVIRPESEKRRLRQRRNLPSSLDLPSFGSPCSPRFSVGWLMHRAATGARANGRR